MSEAQNRPIPEQPIIGGFQIISEIGRGGMGAVYKARQVNMNRDVALKLMKPALARDKRNTERFLREAHASAKLSHPNIVQGIDAGQDKGYFYFAMEFIEGETLKHMIERMGKVPEETCIKIGAQMAKALELAHKHSMIHRDVKPENILIEKSTGLAKLADMGLAKSTNSEDSSVTQTGVALGTPNYISPEQARGEDNLDTRCDIYSLGATLYHAATGTLPFSGETAPVVMSKHMTQPLDPPTKRNPELSMRFSRIIQRMMAKKKEQRYENPTALLTALENLSRPAESTPSPELKRPVPAPDNSKMTLIAACAVGAILVIGGLAYLLSGPAAPPSRTPEATAFFNRAQEIFNVEPNSTQDILKFLNQCIEADPEGPNTEKAKALSGIITEYQNLSGVRAGTTPELLRKMRDLKDFASKHGGTALQKAALVRVKDAAVEGIGRELEAVKNSPIKAPEAIKAITELASVASDDEAKTAADSAKARIKSIINENTEEIFRAFMKPVDDAANERNYKKAIGLAATAVPADFRNEKTEELVKLKTAELTAAAGERMQTVSKILYGTLDGYDLDGAKKVLAEAKEYLDIPENKDALIDLTLTMQLAEKYMPELQKLSDIENKTPVDEKAFCDLARKIVSDFSHDRYIASKKEALEEKIKGFATAALEKELKAKLASLYGLMDRNQYEEASELAEALINDSKSTPELKKAAAELIMTVPDDQRLLLHAVNNMKKKIKAQEEVKAHVPIPRRTGTVSCPISSVNMTRLAATAPEGQTEEIFWENLQKGSIKIYRTIVFQHLPEADPDAQQCLSKYWFAQHEITKEKQNRDDARKAAEAAKKLAEASNAEKYPGREAVMREAKIMILKLDNIDAQEILANLEKEVKQIKSRKHADRLLQEHRDLEIKYAHTSVIDSRDGKDALQKILNMIADWLVRDASNDLALAIKASKWEKVGEICQKVIDDVSKIVNIPDETKKSLERTAEFAEKYLAQQVIYKDVFAQLPWNKGKLDVLARHPDEKIQKSAEFYQSFFKVEIKKYPTSGDQRKWARNDPDKDGKLTVYIKDPVTRVGRYTGVFHHFINDQGAVEQTELDIIGEFYNFGEEGRVMQLVMLDNALKNRPKLLGERRGSFAMARINVMNMNSRLAPLLKFVAQQTAKEYMSEFRAIKDFPVSFCYRYAEISAELNEFDEAISNFSKIIDERKTFQSHGWRAFMARGSLKERLGEFPAALEDYTAAYKQEFKTKWEWDRGFDATVAVIRLCAPSGKMPNQQAIQTLSNHLIKNAGNPDQIKKVAKLLEERNK